LTSASTFEGANNEVVLKELSLLLSHLEVPPCWRLHLCARPNFEAFFWFVLAPTPVDSAVNINGDDAIVLYKNDAIIDVFVTTSTDGRFRVSDGLAA
jgi:hypothetical protein